MQNINVELLTVLDKNIRKGSIVWSSIDGTPDTSLNLYDVFDEISYQENDLIRSKFLLSQAIREVTQSKIKNLENTNSYNKLKSDISNLTTKISSLETKLINGVISIDSVIANELFEKEVVSRKKFKDLNTYISKIEAIKISSYSFLSNLDVTESKVKNIETQHTKNSELIDSINSDLLKLDLSLTNLNMKVLSLKLKSEPFLKDIHAFRDKAIEIRSKLKTILDKLNKVEVVLNNTYPLICDLESKVVQLEFIKDDITPKIYKLKAKIEEHMTNVDKLLCDISLLYSGALNLNTLSIQISDYIDKSVQMIEGGLLVAGENIEIEYINGFAKIHSRLPEYPPRIPPKRDCFDSSPINITFPAPPCPPLVPGCPSCEGSENTTSPPTTTASTGTTTTTDVPACYYVIRKYYGSSKGATSGTLKEITKDCITTYFGGFGLSYKCEIYTIYELGYLATSLDDAHSWISSNYQYDGYYPTSSYSILKLNVAGCVGTKNTYAGGKTELEFASVQYTCVESGNVNQITTHDAILSKDSTANCP